MTFAARLAIVLMLVAVPAGAIDLTGTWDGSYTCQAFEGTSSKAKVKPSTLLIAQTDAVFSANLEGILAFNGGTIDDAADPTGKGEAVMNGCTTDAVPLSGGPGSIFRFKAKVDPASGSGTLSGVGILEQPGGVSTCKFKYKRSNTTPNKFTECPSI